MFLLARSTMYGMKQRGSSISARTLAPSRVLLLWQWTLVFVAVAVLVACGKSSGMDPVDAGDSAADNEAPADSQPIAVTTVNRDTGPQTLADYIGAAASGEQGGRRGQGGFGGDQDATLEQQRRIQQEIQICMQAQGFEYLPEEAGDGLRFFLAAQNQGAAPADYAATEGFGISTRFDVLLEGDLEIEESADPNGDYVARLSEGEADAWNLALSGAPPERNAEGQLVDPETGEVIQRSGPGQRSGGCRLTAEKRVRGDAVVLGELKDELVLLLDRIESDPRVTEIRRQWVGCMSEDGFDYADEREARADINRQVTPLLRSFFASSLTGEQSQGEARWQQGGGGGNPLQAIAGLHLTPEQNAELDALQDLERSMAVTSLACQGDTGQEIADITARYEAEFVDLNREALEGLGS